jgi:hypothetical protein
MLTQPQTIAPMAARLGYAGLIPFAGLALAALLGPAPLAVDAAFALGAYGATILAFLGGVYWGLTIASPAANPRSAPVFLAVGTIPQLLGWLALLAPAPFGHLLTAGGLIALLAADRAVVSRSLAPGWFLALRWPLSLGAALCLLTAGIAIGLR